MTLYEISGELAAILATLEDGELPEVAAMQLDALSVEFEGKAVDICRAVRNLTAEAEALAAEARVLSERRQATERRRDFLRLYLMSHMQRLGMTKVGDAVHGARVVANSVPSVSLDPAVDVAELPAGLLRFKPPELDREAVLARLASGEQLPPGVTVTRGNHLRVH